MTSSSSSSLSVTIGAFPFPFFAVGWGFTLGFGFTGFTFATLSSFTFTFIFWTGGSACRFFPFLTFISSSSESNPELLTDLLTVMVASVLASFAARACRTQLVHLAIPVPPLTSRAGLQIDLHLTGGASRLGVFHPSRSFWRSGWRGRWRNILIIIFVDLPEFLR